MSNKVKNKKGEILGMFKYSLKLVGIGETRNLSLDA